ncbi:MAG TPA: sigma-54 dependent transcriptional regulator [Candidatus Polarisedimenticolia bacterium]|nr:sigma-54 dependent transcriptional regulator [Candidatus Polarisedimenticolia bacterium]
MLPEGKQVLLVERPEQREEIESALRALGLQVNAVGDGAAALDLASREEFDMALVGGVPGDGGSGGIVARLRAGTSIPSILVLATQGEAREAIRTLGQGADDYLLKPLDTTEVQTRIGRILAAQDQDDRVLHLQKELTRKYLLGNLVSRSEGMKRVRDQILQVAGARSTVLILGESGVGKELVAKAIHYNSPRRDAPFIAINCAAIPANLIESELFGHERGAFTGAFGRQKGKFELAHGGTIFLDEIGEMDQATQAKVLRVLEEREFMRVGGAREIRVNVRVLAATNNDLEAMIARRRFREDLYFRLKVISIGVPPLRERVQDIPDLARLFLGQVCRDNGLPPKKLTAKAIRALQRHAWPGNVRELKNVLESTAITRPEERIRSFDLPAAVRHEDPAGPERLRLRAGATLREMERDIIRRTLRRHAGNRTHAARSLHIGVRTLQRKIKAYRIRVPSVPGRRPASRQRSTETPSPASSRDGRM